MSVSRTAPRAVPLAHRARTALATTAAAAAVMLGALAPASATTFQGCGLYVIMGCAKSYGGAQRMAGNGFLVVYTNDYPNFRDGWYCAAEGPFSRNQANSFLSAVQRDVPDAYIKNGC